MLEKAKSGHYVEYQSLQKSKISILVVFFFDLRLYHVNAQLDIPYITDIPTTCTNLKGPFVIFLANKSAIKQIDLNVSTKMKYRYITDTIRKAAYIYNAHLVRKIPLPYLITRNLTFDNKGHIHENAMIEK